MTLSPYPNPPIVEAVVELRFAAGQPWSAGVLDRLSERLREQYVGAPQTQNRFEVQANLHQGAVTTAGQVMLHQVLFPTEDGRALVGVGENLLTVHVLSPYPGWERFLPRVRAALDVYEVEARPSGLVFIAVRYIDQIALPAESDLGLTDFFPHLPARPVGMPPMLDGFHLVTQAHDPTENYAAVLTMASLPTLAADGRLLMLYDLSVLRTFEQPEPASAALAHIDFLHAREKQIFEDSITDATRRLFQ